jgi:hypothetical protein
MTGQEIAERPCRGIRVERVMTDNGPCYVCVTSAPALSLVREMGLEADRERARQLVQGALCRWLLHRTRRLGRECGLCGIQSQLDHPHDLADQLDLQTLLRGRNLDPFDQPTQQVQRLVAASRA